MREILFRGQTRRKGEKVYMGTGKPVDGNWVYGGITQGTGDFSVMYSYSPVEKHVVYTDTVGQFTGLKDKNGKKIFEGDIVAFEDGPASDYYRETVIVNRGVIKFADGAFYVTDRETVDMGDLIYNGAMECEIIGNIHDNPELLKE